MSERGNRQLVSRLMLPSKLVTSDAIAIHQRTSRGSCKVERAFYRQATGARRCRRVLSTLASLQDARSFEGVNSLHRATRSSCSVIIAGQSQRAHHRQRASRTSSRSAAVRSWLFSTWTQPRSWRIIRVCARISVDDATYGGI
jgi:hypothetical protein